MYTESVMNENDRQKRNLNRWYFITACIFTSLIILAGVMHIFINNKQTYRVQEAFARLQENGRFALNLLVKDIRMAGYIGCAGIVSKVNNMADLRDPKGTADAVGDFTGNGLGGYEYSSLPVALSETVNLDSSEVVAGTDIIHIKGGRSTGARLDGNYDVNNAQIQLDPTTAVGLFNVDDYLFISDCEHADIFVANSVSLKNVPNGDPVLTITHSNNNIGTKLSPPLYRDDAEILKFINSAYYIGTNAAGNPALFRTSLANAGAILKEELVEGVEDMQILYGEDTDGNGIPDTYVPANGVANMENVTSVRVELQVRSLEDNLTAKMTAYSDRKLRRTFTTSIAIRNRAT